MKRFWERHPTTTGFFVGWLLFASLFYFVQFQAHGDLQEGCARGNVLREGYNQRGEAIDLALHTLIAEGHQGEGLAVTARKIVPIPLVNCSSAYPAPWPFGG